MSQFFLPIIQQAEIPKIFWSDLNNQPFNKCISCERNLLDEHVEYMIEKAFQSTNISGVNSTIFEYAMCFDCADQLRNQLSTSSLKNIDRFYAERANFESRRNKLISFNNLDIDLWLKDCIINQRPYQVGEEFQIYGQCVGKNFIYADMPFMISGQALEEIIELISNETMDELDNFKDKLTSGPPEFMELLNSTGARVFI